MQKTLDRKTKGRKQNILLLSAQYLDIVSFNMCLIAVMKLVPEQRAKKRSFFRNNQYVTYFCAACNHCVKRMPTIRIHFQKYSHTLFCGAKILPALHDIPICVFAHNVANKSWGVWGFSLCPLNDHLPFRCLALTMPNLTAQVCSALNRMLQIKKKNVF